MGKRRDGSFNNMQISGLEIPLEKVLDISKKGYKKFLSPLSRKGWKWAVSNSHEEKYSPGCWICNKYSKAGVTIPERKEHKDAYFFLFGAAGLFSKLHLWSHLSGPRADRVVIHFFCHPKRVAEAYQSDYVNKYLEEELKDE